MAANTTPLFTLTPVSAVGQISTANTNRDGTGTIATIKSAGTNGTRIDYVRVVATGTTTAGVVRLFVNDGTNSRLWKEILVTAVTPSTTVEVFSAEVRPVQEGLPLMVLPSGFSLNASTNNAETFNVFVHGGDY